MARLIETRIERDELYPYYYMSPGAGANSSRERRVVVPTKLMDRYLLSIDEFFAVQALLEELYEEEH